MPGVHELVVVANRLPVDRREEPDGSTSWQPSPGGLVTALEPVMRENHGAWIGWTGGVGDAPEEFDAQGMHLLPLALTEQEISDYYEGMSNGTLWPLYHDVISPPGFHRHWWEAYVSVNRRFAAAAAEQAAEGGSVWVQDYQLQLVPQLLRALRPDLRIGFFNHIPFPPYELYSQLPWRRQILEGLLGADLLGFQRPTDANNVLRACRRMGLPTRRGVVRVSGPSGEREVRCLAFPISVDARGLDEISRRPQVVARAKEIRAELGDPEIMLLGVDRLDYTKGILHRLQAVGELYDDGRLASPGAVFVQVATPSRERVESYQALRQEVEVVVGRINGDHGHLGNPPVHYLHQSFPREELVALYLAADVLLVTALRDGMNLVAKEYVACRHDERGALVLSEFTGAAGELPQAFLINPHDIEGMKSAIMRATRESPRAIGSRMTAMRRQVFSHDVNRWAAEFLRSLGRSGDGDVLPDALPEALADALDSLAARDAVLVAVDFDGTLAPLVNDPEQARALPDAMAALARLAALDNTQVALVSGRSLADLRRVASPPPGAVLIGGHGSELEQPAEQSPELSPEPSEAGPLLERLTAALREISATHPGTEVETKAASVVLHTRRAERDVAASATRVVLDGAATWPGVQLMHGKEIVELSVSDVTKGSALVALRERLGVPAGGVLYLGDDVTDERAFAVLDADAGDVAVKVGPGVSLAAHRVSDPESVAALLTGLASLRAAIVTSRAGAR